VIIRFAGETTKCALLREYRISEDNVWQCKKGKEQLLGTSSARKAFCGHKIGHYSQHKKEKLWCVGVILKCLSK
jgi:hypothetical protein